MSDDLLSIGQAAARIHCSEKTLRRWVHDGVLPERRIGNKKLLFVSHELDAVILRSGTASATSPPPEDDAWISVAVGLKPPSKKVI